jgi:hypothetical protein
MRTVRVIVPISGAALAGTGTAEGRGSGAARAAVRWNVACTDLRCLDEIARFFMEDLLTYKVYGAHSCSSRARDEHDHLVLRIMPTIPTKRRTG